MNYVRLRVLRGSSLGQEMGKTTKFTKTTKEVGTPVPAVLGSRHGFYGFSTNR